MACLGPKSKINVQRAVLAIEQMAINTFGEQ